MEIVTLSWTRPVGLVALVALPVLLIYWQRSLSHLSAGKKLVSVLLRTLFVMLMSAALVGPVLTLPSSKTTTVAVIDASRSVSPQAGANVEPFVSMAAQSKADFRQLRFAGTVETPQLANPTVGDTGETNIAAALVAARATIPADRVGKIVLFSDGNATTGDAVGAAKAVGVPVYTVPLPSVDPEVAVTGVEAPSNVRAGENFFVDVRLQSTQPGEVEVELTSLGQFVDRQKVNVTAGESRVRFKLKDLEPGVKLYTAHIKTTGDTLPENNSASCGLSILPRPKVLVVDRETALAEHLKQALVKENIDVEVRTPDKLLATANDLGKYELVILSNVPAVQLPQKQMEALKAYVHDDGGGLIVVGGDSSFTAGGYRGTVLEDALPVISEVKKDRPQPTLAMVLVLDISGSMEGQRMELAKQALSRAIDRLSPRDQVGVLVFEDESRWIAPLGTMKDKDKILSQIKGIKAEGATTMYPAMERAYLALRSAPADRKHMIVMTDGVSNPGDFDGLARQINADGISVSMVGVGGEPARPLLQGIADTAKGRAYFPAEVTELPKIFEMETLAAGRPGVTEERFIPKVLHSVQLLRGIDFEQAPLLGYVATQARPESHVILATKNDEPLLALWRYGRGASAAFTSDVQSDWAGVWFNWRNFGKFWVQLVRQTMRSELPPESKLTATFSDGKMHLILDAIDRQGHLIIGGSASVIVSDPDNKLSKPLSPRFVMKDKNGIGSGQFVDYLPFCEMTPIAPGRFAADLRYIPGEVHQLLISIGQNGKTIDSFNRFVSQPYADEYRIKPTNIAALKQIAEVSGGKFDPKPEEVFAASEATVSVKTLLTPWLLLVSAIVFLLDLGLKRM